MRDQINIALKDAIKAKDKVRISTVRLINAAIKDRDIAARGDGKEAVSDQDIIGIISKMLKQRHESVKIYSKAGRDDLVEQEENEIQVLTEFLPKQLSDDEVTSAIDNAVASTGAESLRDMGKVMADLKSNFDGQMDFGAAGKLVRERLHQ